MSTPTDNTEPVRLRGWTAVAASAAVAFTVAYLSGTDVRGALLVAILTAAPMVAGIEWQRKGAWSPVSVSKATTVSAQLAQSRPEEMPLPPDVLLGYANEGPEALHRYTYPHKESTHD